MYVRIYEYTVYVALIVFKCDTVLDDHEFLFCIKIFMKYFMYNCDINGTLIQLI